LTVTSLVSIWEYVSGLIKYGAESPENTADRKHAAPAIHGRIAAVTRELWNWLRGFRRQDAAASTGCAPTHAARRSDSLG
jgi:hypothetical protein